MSQGFADMFVEMDQDPRGDAPARGDERETLLGFLRWHRQTLELKCAGLDAEQLARRAIPPSTLSLLGLVRHMAEVERSWFQRRMAKLDAPPLYYSDDAPDDDFDGAVADPAVVAEAWAAWRAQMAFTDQFIVEAPNLEITCDGQRRGRLSLRWVLVHMIEEYARHNGHADLLRQVIDGRVGQ